jgi:predicted helicase
MDNNIITRDEKLEFLENTKFKDVKWKTLTPVNEPKYWFVDIDIDPSSQDEYNKFLNMEEIFNIVSSGNETERDTITIHYNKQNLDKVIADFINLSEQDIAIKYKLKDSRDWKVSLAKNDLIANKGKNLYAEISYRPFDKRITYCTGKSKGFIGTPSVNNKHFKNENIGLCFTKKSSGSIYQNVFIAENMIERGIVSSKTSENTSVAPLYLYLDENAVDGASMPPKPNFTNEFNNFLKTLNFRPKPEKILAYIYAILHSLIYRRKYIELLKRDYPAIPFTKNKEIFEKYAKLGQKLIDLHLLNKIPDDKTIKLPKEVDFPFTINNITHIDNKLLLHTTENKIITIEGITKEIYDFEIGSYKPIDKWLKYRKKDSVSLNSKDLKHIKDMAIAIKNTIAVMSELESFGEEYLK